MTPPAINDYLKVEFGYATSDQVRPGACSANLRKAECALRSRERYP